jgi:hypothetical protein
VADAGVTTPANSRPGSENMQHGKLQGILGEALGWLGGTGSEWRGSSPPVSTMAHDRGDTHTRGGEACVLYARLEVVKRFVHTS